MRQLGWIVLGVVAGFLLGGVGPRRDAADLQSVINELRDDLAQARKKAARSRRTNVLPLPGLSDLYQPPAGEARDDDGRDDDGVEGGGDGDSLTVGERGDERGRGDAPPPISADEFDLAVDAQALRAAQSRAALAEQAALSDRDLDDFDALIGDMNDDLAGIADDLIDLAWAGQDAPPADLLSVSHEVTGILLDAQAGLDDMVDPGAEVDETATQVWNYVDLDVLRAAALEGERE